MVRRDLAGDSGPYVDEARTVVDVILLLSALIDLDAHGELPWTFARRESWARTRALANEVLAADVILLGTPMYDHSVASLLKAWLDNVTFPLLPMTGKRAVVATGRGHTYTPDAEEDDQQRFLRAWFAKLGLTDVQFLDGELTLAPAFPRVQHFAEAHAQSAW